MEFILILVVLFIILMIIAPNLANEVQEHLNKQNTYASTDSPEPIRTLESVRAPRGNPYMSNAERNAYLQSPKWKALRQQIIERDKVCKLTGDTNNLEVHHIHYDNLGDEYLDDLVLLSRKAHQAVHEYYGSYDRTGYYDITPLKNTKI